MRYFNMALNNAFRVYQVLAKEHTPDRRLLTMPMCVKELAHALMQSGDDMRVREAGHPLYTRDMTNVFDLGTGQAVRSDAKGVMADKHERPQVLKRLAILQKQQKKAHWRMHQSVAGKEKGRCCWKNCEGLKASKAACPRRPETHMRCEECSALLGKNIFLCNGYKAGKVYSCHLQYHSKYHTQKD
jgi:hypothetical protein